MTQPPPSLFNLSFFIISCFRPRFCSGARRILRGRRLTGRFFLIAAMLFACAQCLPAKDGPRGRFVPRGIDVNREFAEALANFYAPIHPEDLARLQQTIAGSCDIRLAARGLHYNAVRSYQGDFIPGDTKGTFCFWNQRDELVEFGQYDAKGKLEGVHATFYREKLRSLRTRVKSAPAVTIARGWDWVMQNREWNTTLAYVKLENLRPNRTVEYIFERESGHLIKRREYREVAVGGGDSKKIHLGVHYNGYPSKEYPQCVEYLPGGKKRVIEQRCSFQDEILPDSNRF